MALGLFLSISIIAASFATPAQAAKRTPVVFVPGFMGSRLVDKHGELWGSFSTMIRRFDDLRYRGQDPRNPVRATEVLDKLQLFGPIEVAGYQPIIELFRKLGYRENRDLFLFAYDWRKSNLDNARLLSAFVETTPALRDHRFDLVAHSMGGVLASYFILHAKGAAKVRHFVTLGTAHLGSANVLANMLGVFDADIAKLRYVIGEDAFLKVFFSFPSIYEQLPYDNRSCLQAVHSGKKSRICDALALAFWSNADMSNRVRRYLPANLGRYLANARELRRTACPDLPSGIRIFRFAGTQVETIGQIKMVFDRRFSLERIYVPGDGTVPERSASCGDLAGTDVFFADHHGLLENKLARYRLANILSNGDTGRPRGLDTKPALAALPKASLSLDSRYLAAGENFSADLVLRQSDGRPLVGEIVSAALLSEDDPSKAREIIVVETQPGRYRIAARSGTAPGIYRLGVSVPGAGTLQEHFAVLSSAKKDVNAEAPDLNTAQQSQSLKQLPFRALLSSPRGRTALYHLGEKLNLIVRANRDAWLYCFHRQTTGGLIKIFPNKHNPNAFIPGNQVHAIPGNEYPFEMEFVAPAGKERTRCFATDRDVTRDLPAVLRNMDFEPLPEAIGKRLPEIFKVLPNTKTSHVMLDIDVRP